MPTTTTTTTTEQPRSPLSNEIFLGFCFSIGCATLLAVIGNYHESPSTQTSTPEMFSAGRASAWAQQRFGSSTGTQAGSADVPPAPPNP